MAQWIYDIIKFNDIVDLVGQNQEVYIWIAGFFAVMLFVIFVDIVVNGLFRIFKK